MPPVVAGPDGPPAHWLERVRQAAPGLVGEPSRPGGVRWSATSALPSARGAAAAVPPWLPTPRPTAPDRGPEMDRPLPAAPPPPVAPVPDWPAAEAPADRPRAELTPPRGPRVRAPRTAGAPPSTGSRPPPPPQPHAPRAPVAPSEVQLVPPAETSPEGEGRLAPAPGPTSALGRRVEPRVQWRGALTPSTTRHEREPEAARARVTPPRRTATGAAHEMPTTTRRHAEPAAAPDVVPAAPRAHGTRPGPLPDRTVPRSRPAAAEPDAGAAGTWPDLPGRWSVPGVGDPAVVDRILAALRLEQPALPAGLDDEQARV